VNGTIEKPVSIDVEISNRQYIAAAVVTFYASDDIHVEWLSVREPFARRDENFEDENWRDCLYDYRADAIEAAGGVS
jgi:hypothetical protein